MGVVKHVLARDQSMGFNAQPWSFDVVMRTSLRAVG